MCMMRIFWRASSYKLQAASRGASPEEVNAVVKEQHAALIEKATAIFNDPELRSFIVDVRKKYDQVIDTINRDEIVNIGWVKDNKAAAESLVHDFAAWIEELIRTRSLPCRSFMRSLIAEEPCRTG